MGTKVVEVTEFNSEVRCDLRGCFEAAMASEAIKMAVSAICTWIPELSRLLKSGVKLGF